MNEERFGEIVRRHVILPSCDDDIVKSLIEPKGRKPNERLVELSKWYNAKDSDEKGLIRELILDACEASIFHFFCLLDGGYEIQSEPDLHQLILTHVGPEGAVVLGNSETGSDLHSFIFD